MLSAITTVLLVCVMFSLVAAFGVGALREYRRHKRALATQSLPTHPLDHHVTAVLHLQDGMIVGVEQPTPPPAFSLSHAWYTRRRMLVSLGLLFMLLLAFFLQGGLASDAFHNLTQGISFLSDAQSQSIDLQTAPHPLPDTASTRVVRVDSALRNQYYTDYQWHVWSYTSCSGIALETVMNAYGKHFIAADVLQEEQKLGVWDVRLGLLNEQGITQTANYLGFKTNLSHTRTLQDLIITSNEGTPVIVSVRDSYYFPGGHILVVRGGDSQYVYTADSSPGNFQRMTYAMFRNMWAGNNNFSAIVTPA